jgi:inhibitor of cysteine peptidase
MMGRKVQANGGLIAALLAALILVTGCGFSEGGNANAAERGQSTQEVSLDAAADGSQVELSAGQVLVITLASNPTTGYRWEVIDLDTAVLRQVGEAEFQSSDAGDAPLVGAGGVEVFHFEAAGSGQTALTLVYHRPWEEGVDPLETFAVQITVR